MGISAFYHDSAATLLIDGKIIAAAQEERFSRIKNDSAFPKQAISYVLKESGIPFNEINAITFYDKPLLKFERLLETFHAFAPKGIRMFLKAIPVWIKDKLFTKNLLRKELSQFGDSNAPILFTEHHLSHAASAFYPSPYNEAAILTIDGVGEWATATICIGKYNSIRILKELHFPHSIGLLYSAFTYYLGFKVNRGEYKVMGLAPYGHPNSERVNSFRKKICSEIVDMREDGSLLLNMDYFHFTTKLTMTNDKKWEALFGVSRRVPETEIKQEHMDLAMAIQLITESIVVSLAKTAHKITGCSNLVMAGGVALNCVGNTKILEAKIFDHIWVQPAAGDSGGSLGAAYATHYIYFDKERKVSGDECQMNHAYLGPEYSNTEVKRTLTKYNAVYTHFQDFEKLTIFISQMIADDKIVGWFQGRMEFGPRALGNRSILANPLLPETQKKLNLKIKFREAFRPFAPSVLEEDYQNYFAIDSPSPFMLFMAGVKKEIQKPEPEDHKNLDMYNRLYHLRSEIPAVTHVDYSARLQTVRKISNPRFWQLITDFKKITGYGILVNTSFNVRGEPIVCNPQDAYLAFMRAEIDYLVMGNYVLDRKDQTPPTPPPD